MININVTVDETGLLKSCKVTGHAGAGQRGSDIVCAAVSVLTRTALKVLSGQEGVFVRGSAPERGCFEMETGYTGSGRTYLDAAGTFLLDGLDWVSREYPDNCNLIINTERRQ